MLKEFTRRFSNYLIESKEEFLIYLIPGEIIKEHLDWYGKKRAEAFNQYKLNLKNDIEERDLYYTHMIIFNKKTMEIAGGQRFLFNKNFLIKNKNHSYLEQYHPGTYQKLINKSFCEIGRTFVMPKFKNTKILRELIRGFVKIPESKNIEIGLGLISFNNKKLNKISTFSFIDYLEKSKQISLNLPKGKYAFDIDLSDEITKIKYLFEYKNLNSIEKEIQKVDNNFRLPAVLRPYIKLCGLKYEGYSIAKDYNGIVQLLFSGEYKNISHYPMKIFAPYENL